MTQAEIEERFNKSITALKSLEQILKGMDANYETHITRLSWLKHLLDSCTYLKQHETYVLSQISQQRASKVAEVVQPPVEQVASIAPTPQTTTDQESVKKTRKKAE